MKKSVATDTKNLSGHAKITSAGDTNKIGFFYTAPATHHFYYLLPYIRVSKHRSVMIFNATDIYFEQITKIFPDINFIHCSVYTPRETIALFNQFEILIFANGYQWFKDDIEPNLNKSLLLIRTLHGSSHKFADDRAFYVNSVFGWDGVIIHGQKDLDMFFDHLSIPASNRQYGKVLDASNNKGRKIRIIQSGNLRAQDFFNKKIEKSKLIAEYSFLDPDKKTILVMPTHPNNPSKSITSYSSLGFFIDLLEKMRHPEKYNFLFKLHPMLIFDKEMRLALIEICDRKSIPIHYEIYTADYFPLMQLADIMITDRSSSVFDFLLFNKPIIFLDSTSECPDKIEWNDRQCTFWTFQLGCRYSPKTLGEFDQLIETALNDDQYVGIRQKVADYTFSKNMTAQLVIKALFDHPKLNQPAH